MFRMRARYWIFRASNSACVRRSRIHANRYRAPVLRLRVLRPQSSEQGRTCSRPCPAPAGAAGRKGCPRSRRKPQPEPSSSGARHGHSTGCRAGGHPPATALRPHRPPENPPTRGTPPVSGEGHSTGSPASAHPGYPLSSADQRRAELLAATAGHRVHRRGQGLPMTSLPQPPPGVVALPVPGAPGKVARGTCASGSLCCEQPNPDAGRQSNFPPARLQSWNAPESHGSTVFPRPHSRGLRYRESRLIGSNRTALLRELIHPYNIPPTLPE